MQYADCQEAQEALKFEKVKAFGKTKYKNNQISDPASMNPREYLYIQLGVLPTVICNIPNKTFNNKKLLSKSTWNDNNNGNKQKKFIFKFKNVDKFNI